MTDRSIDNAASQPGDRLVTGLVTVAFGLGTGGLIWIGMSVRSCLALIGT